MFVVAYFEVHRNCRRDLIYFIVIRTFSPSLLQQCYSEAFVREDRLLYGFFVLKTFFDFVRDYISVYFIFELDSFKVRIIVGIMKIFMYLNINLRATQQALYQENVCEKYSLAKIS